MAIQEIIVRDFWWKFLAFVLASLVWANFGGRLDDRIELDEGGVHVLNEPGQLTDAAMSKPMSRSITVLRGSGVTGAFRVEPAEARVIVKGESGRLRTLDPKLILAFVDVTDMNESANGTVPGRPVSRIVQVYLPAGVELLSVEPRSVIVERIPLPEPSAAE
jgi:hypothetical protein